MSDSKLISGTLLTENHSDGRGAYQITRITPHYMDWYTDARTCAESFVPKARQASANYCIGVDGEIVLNVHESDRAWTSGSYDNDNRAVTIECANYTKDEGGHVIGELPKATWDSLVALCADIVRRNGYGRLQYTGSTEGRAGDAMLLTMHRWFQSTDCPGPWLSNQFGRLADEVNKVLEGGNVGKVNPANVAALIHYDMVTDPRNGYSQAPERWGGDHPDGTKRLDIDGRSYYYPIGSYDCSSSVIWAWRQAIRYTKYEGILDAATYTGDMRDVFTRSGLFQAKYSAAKRGDLYLAEQKHVAMCQDGGDEGTFGYDALSEFNRNENFAATNGKVGDQDGGESIVREYYDDGWNTVLHYVGGLLDDVSGKHDQPAESEEDDMRQEVRCILQAPKGDKLFYFDGTRARHIGPDQLKGLQAVWKSAGVPLRTVEIPQSQIDAMTRL